MKENYVCSTYFKNNANIQSGVKFKDDDFEYMRKWYESIEKYNLNSVVFYDNLNSELLSKYRDKIQFIKTEQNSLNIIDYRWIIYNEYLKKNINNINLILFTDISDVVLLKNPFDFIITKPNTLFVGDEIATLGHPWIKKRTVLFYEILPDIIEHEKLNKRKKLLNCGIIGGEIEIVAELIHEMANILLKANLQSTTYDMVVLNYLIYNKYNDKFFSGSPLNTRFKRHEKNNTECYVMHK